MIVLLPFIITNGVAELSFRKQWIFFFFHMKPIARKCCRKSWETLNITLICFWSRIYRIKQSCKKSLRSLRQIHIFPKHLLFLSTFSSRSNSLFHVSTTAAYFSRALTNAVLLISMANAPAKIVVPACHWSWWWMLASLADQRQELIFQWEMRYDR